jgi:hypothetical protein
MSIIIKLINHHTVAPKFSISPNNATQKVRQNTVFFTREIIHKARDNVGRFFTFVFHIFVFSTIFYVAISSNSKALNNNFASFFFWERKLHFR